MNTIIFVCLGVATLGILVDIVNCKSIASIEFVFDMIVLLTVITSIAKYISSWNIL